MNFYTGDLGAHREHRLHALARAIARPFLDAWQCRELVRVIVWRELSQRFSQSYFGWVWAILAPLTLLAIYTFVFSNVIDIRGGKQNYALSIFVGIILFNLFAELAHRAPTLLPEHAQFIKKSIFPLEILGWTSLLRAFAYAGIGLAVFLVFEVILTGRIPLTVFLLPLLVIPFSMFLLGTIWFLAALGAFTRDVAFLMITIIPVLIFASPVFYAAGDVPLSMRLVTYVNPLTSFIEVARDILLLGWWPDPFAYVVGWLYALNVFYGGYAFFMRYRSVVVDVL
jgi:lipopolysaccharide transport system permease protein